MSQLGEESGGFAGIGGLAVFTVALIMIKQGGNVDWPWILVLLPIGIPITILVVGGIIAGIIAITETPLIDICIFCNNRMLKINGKFSCCDVLCAVRQKAVKKERA